MMIRAIFLRELLSASKSASVDNWLAAEQLRSLFSLQLRFPCVRDILISLSCRSESRNAEWQCGINDVDTLSSSTQA